MGKVRTRVIGIEDVEEEQKKEQKKRSSEKKATVSKKKVKAKGQKGSERMVSLEVDDESMKKMEKAKKLIEATPEPKKKEPEKKESTKEITVKIRGKKYENARSKVNKKQIYSLTDAITLLKKIKYAKFDESVELHLNIDAEGLKGEVELPHSTGKTTRVKIVDDAVIEAIGKGIIELDLLISHPSYMPKLAKFAKVLGPKGLMPNPKSGTISPNPEEAAKKFSKGTLRWKSEVKFPLIHQMVGKISLKEASLLENVRAYFSSVGKPHIHSAFIKTTMSPSLKLDIESI